MRFIDKAACEALVAGHFPHLIHHNDTPQAAAALAR
jgi:hypothetical protein